MKIQQLCLFLTLVGLITCSGGSIAYDYADQGDAWSTLGDCDGTKQSPIDLTAWSATNCNTDIKFQLEFDDAAMSNVELKFPGDSSNPKNVELVGAFTEFRANTIEDQENSFSALQFHLHAPSEHTVGGVRYDAELHIVHKLNNDVTTDYGLAVFSLFFNEDSTLDQTAQDNTLFGKLDFENLSETTGTISSLTASTLFADVDLTKGLWAYQGSLTTPPCTEAVNWFISSDIQAISTAQLTALEALLADDTNAAINSALGNYRKVQGLNGRTVENVCANQNTAAFSYVSPPPPKKEEENDDDDDGENTSRLFFTYAIILIFAVLL